MVMIDFRMSLINSSIIVMNSETIGMNSSSIATKLTPIRVGVRECQPNLIIDLSSAEGLKQFTRSCFDCKLFVQ